jgi:4-amino-4-deoxy-L-arabinose transferase-like glycosyltransferase
LFAILYATSGLWLAWRLYGRLLTPDKRIVALACLTFVPYFNFHGLRFDHNAVLGPLWAATALCFIRSYDTRAPLWAALAGAAAAAAMLGKYWSIFLLAGLALAAITDVRRAAYFRSAAPWITIAVGALLLAPHFIWLVQLTSCR